jgi:hypothetical protein
METEYQTIFEIKRKLPQKHTEMSLVKKQLAGDKLDKPSALCF